MQSPLARVILLVFAGYGLILGVLMVKDWVDAEFPRASDEASITVPPHDPQHQASALRALHHFQRMSEAERRVMRASLAANLIPIGQWLAEVAGSGSPLICLGELHETATRRFLAGTVFTTLPVDLLLLEATPREMKRLNRWAAAGRDYVPLQGADMAQVMRITRENNPEVEILGIEETRAQAAAHPRETGARDRAIARNFWRAYQPGKRHLILFGALHCAATPAWLYANIHDQAPEPLRDQMMNVQVLGVHQSGSLGALVAFLDEIGVQPTDFVIADTHGLPQPIHRWFPALMKDVLSKYSAVIVFRSLYTK
jgi:hypothetical protein